MPPTHNWSKSTHAITDITHTNTHTEHASRPAPPQSPPLLRNEVVIEVDTGDREKNEELGVKKGLSIFFLRWKRTKKVTVTVITARRRDNSKRKLSVEVVQCSSLGTKDSSPKQCRCLWPVMKIGWVVESPALGNCGTYSNLFFCSTILVRKHWICDLVCGPLSDFYGHAEFKFKPPVGSTVCSSGLTKVFPWSTPNSFIAL